jgi:hypothetical protein
VNSSYVSVVEPEPVVAPFDQTHSSHALTIAIFML